MRPSLAVEQNRAEICQILAHFRMENPRLFGSVARGEDIDGSDLDILVDVAPGISLYDLARIETELEALLHCKVEVVTSGFLSRDVAQRIATDIVLLR